MASSAPSAALKELGKRQSELNNFLWTTELLYSIVRDERYFENLPPDQLARDALAHIRSEAWVATAKSRKAGAPSGKFHGTIAEVREQIDTNVKLAYCSVAVMFIAEFEIFVKHRFAGWFEEASLKHIKDGKKGPFMVPPPIQLLKRLRAYFTKPPMGSIAIDVVLKADLMKTIRNLYAHKSQRGTPRGAGERDVIGWIAKVREDDPKTSEADAKAIVNEVIGKAVASNRKAVREGKNLGEEFFYAIFTFTNIRNFAVALDQSCPANPPKGETS